MAYFTATDLRCPGYATQSRENHDDVTETCFSDNRPLAVKEREEMVSFINAVARFSGWKTKGPGYRLERMLRQHLPGGIRGRIDILNWATQNWDKYEV